MKSDKYKNCAVIYRQKCDGERSGYLYYVGLYNKDGWCEWLMKNSGNEVRLYKTIKFAERYAKKYGYNEIKYNWEDK